MANEISANHPSGATVYFIVRNASGQVWYVSGQTFEDWGGGAGRDMDDYDIAMTDKTGSKYLGDMDTNIAAGEYDIQIFIKSGANPADGDPCLGSNRRFWSGSRLWSDPAVLLETTISSVQTPDTVFDLTEGSTEDDIYNNGQISIEDATGSALDVHLSKVSDYAGTNKRITIDRECAFTLAGGDIVRIYRQGYSPTVAAGSAPTVDEIWEGDITDKTTPGMAGYELFNSGSHLSR